MCQVINPNQSKSLVVIILRKNTHILEQILSDLHKVTIVNAELHNCSSNNIITKYIIYYTLLYYYIFHIQSEMLNIVHLCVRTEYFYYTELYYNSSFILEYWNLFRCLVRIYLDYYMYSIYSHVSEIPDSNS